MKPVTLCLALVATASPFAVAGEVMPGDSMTEVRAVLGNPKGQVKRQDRQVLYFERGSVEIQQGRVIAANLRTQEEHAILKEREEQGRVSREAVRARMIAAGVALRDSKLADDAFRAAPLAYQVSFWENFAQSYPGVSCAEPLTIARLRLNAQLDEQRRRDEEAERMVAREERYAAEERQATFYPIRVTSGYRGHREYYRESSLGPITYNFYSSSLAPYSTPRGNPAGSLSGSLVNPGYISDPVRNDEVRDDRCDYSHGRGQGAENGRGHRQGRM